MDWIGSARNRLMELRRDSVGWGYRPVSAPYVEPTVLAGLALAATSENPQSALASKNFQATGDWLAELQGVDGSVGPSQLLKEPSWPTPFALVYWIAVDSSHPNSKPRYARQRQKAAQYLEGLQGTLLDLPEDIMGHDGMIPGWPWVPKTHAWIEPTSMAILALCLQGRSTIKRVEDGRRLIRDRSLPQGGWNYGNTVVLNTELRPQPGPTGWALLGLAGDNQASRPIWLGIKYLLSELTTLRAAPSLGVGLLALTFWGKRPVQADAWLAEAYPEASRRSDTAYQIAFLLLATRAHASLSLLGLKSVRGADSK
jgi:hypothetical protein